MGCLFYICLLLVALLVLGLVVEAVQRLFKIKVLGTVTYKIWSFLTPALYTRLFFEMNFELGICSYLQIKIFTWAVTNLDIFSNILAILGAFFTFLVPVISTIVIVRLQKLELLHEQKTKKHFGAFYEL